MYFNQQGGPEQFRGYHARLDIRTRIDALVEKNQVDDKLCCPRDDDFHGALADRGATGFCMRQIGDPAFLPRSDSRFRSLKSEKTAVGPQSIGEDVKLASAKLSERELMSTASFCANMQSIGQQQGLNGACFSLESCMLLQAESGGGACGGLPQAVEAENLTCKTLATNPAFAVDNNDECFSGVSFEVSKNGGPWQAVYKFPVGESYCDDKVHIVFDHIEIDGVKLNLDDFDVRFTKCLPGPECGDKCQPTSDIATLNARFTYPCLGEDVTETLFDLALAECATCFPTDVTGFADCVKTCVGENQCCPVDV